MASVQPDPRPAYYSNWGPRDACITWSDRPSDLDVHDEPDKTLPVGVAYLVGYVSSRRGPVCLFRLVVGGVKLDGLFVCDCRRFVRLEDTIA